MSYRALLFGVKVRAPDVLKLPCFISHVLRECDACKQNSPEVARTILDPSKGEPSLPNKP